MFPHRQYFGKIYTSSGFPWTSIPLILLALVSVTAHRTYQHSSYSRGRSSEFRVEKVEIPSPVQVGQTVQMSCSWRVGSLGFYSLRWYKDDSQVYTLIVGGEGHSHQVEGIHVVLKESDDHVLTIKGVTAMAEGVYKCEIMSEGPQFKITEGKANLTVVELPETPKLLGLKNSYDMGDTLNVTCVAQNGRPAPTLIFQINGLPLHEESGRVRQLPSIPGDRPGLFTSASVLEMPLSDSHHPRFTLGCAAYAHGLKVQKDVTIQVSDPIYNFLDFFGRSSSDNLKKYSTTIIQVFQAIFACFIYFLPENL